MRSIDAKETLFPSFSPRRVFSRFYRGSSHITICQARMQATEVINSGATRAPATRHSISACQRHKTGTRPAQKKANRPRASTHPPPQIAQRHSNDTLRPPRPPPLHPRRPRRPRHLCRRHRRRWTRSPNQSQSRRRWDRGGPMQVSMWVRRHRSE
jgi:hypothetical protein